MAYVGSDLVAAVSGQFSGNRGSAQKKGKKKQGTSTDAQGMIAKKMPDGTIISQDRAVQTPAASKLGAGTYTSKNTTTNARAGQKFRTETKPGGVVHVYESGERVFVKKPKKSNPSRKLY